MIVVGFLVDIMKNILKEKMYNISFTYLFFLVVIILMFFHPNILIDINVNHWISDNLRTNILTISNSIYNKFLWIIILITILIGFMIVLLKINFSKDNRNMTYYEGEIEERNFYSGITRLVKILIIIMTYIWVFHFFINISLTENEFIDIFINFFDFSKDLSYEFMTKLGLSVNKVFFVLNIAVLVLWIFNSLTSITVKNNITDIKASDLESDFYILDKINEDVLFLKAQDSENQYYYIVKKVKGSPSKNIHKILYKVNDKSINYDEISTTFARMKNRDLD